MGNISLNDIKKTHKYYNNEFFARWAKLYDNEKYLLSSLRKRAAKFLELKPPRKILDVATGTGSQAHALAMDGHSVIGIDLSPEMLAQAVKKLSDDIMLSFQRADATELPFRDSEFDASSISLGLHDMPYRVNLKVLQEMIRVTKRKGKILIVDYNEPRKHWAAKLAFPIINSYETKNWKPFIERGLNELLKKVNLKIHKETHFFGLVQIVIVDNKK